MTDYTTELAAHAVSDESTQEDTEDTGPESGAELLRIATAGSVDDGKSTLVGRLLYDSKAVLADQLEAIERVRLRRGDADVDLALLTDGLRAEREQGITIDVAYRYFSTKRRKFIIADTPGHVQYTRNMVTGASTANVAIVLVDVRKGVVTQSRRHGFVSSLLRIPHIVVAINKMDLVDYSEARFSDVVEEYQDFARRLAIESLTFVPISALQGDNVVQRSERMPWYRGPSLLELLESLPVDGHADAAEAPLRIPAQMALRTTGDFRGVSGQVASGRVSVGDAVTILPIGRRTHVTSLFVAGEEVTAAAASDSVVFTLADDIDVGRGDMIVRSGDEPELVDSFQCVLCWLDERPLDPGVTYLLQHTTRETAARVERLIERIDVNTLTSEPAAALALNDIGVAEISVASPLAIDPYDKSRVTGSFILIDPRAHNTVAAGLIGAPARDGGAGSRSWTRVGINAASDLRDGCAVAPGERVQGEPAERNLAWDWGGVSREAREARNRHAAAVLWFTGLSGAGKSTIARLLDARLFALGVQTMRLDGDNLRHGLNADLGFGDEDRSENIRRVAQVARLAFDHGQIALCTLISPFRKDRDLARALLPQGRFIEVFVRCDVDECRRRDPKGLYARADRGEIAQFTGVTSPYEEPVDPEIVIDTSQQSADELVDAILGALRARGVIART